LNSICFAVHLVLFATIAALIPVFKALSYFLATATFFPLPPAILRNLATRLLSTLAIARGVELLVTGPAVTFSYAFLALEVVFLALLAA
jgi:hypothetical protein